MTYPSTTLAGRALGGDYVLSRDSAVIQITATNMWHRSRVKLTRVLVAAVGCSAPSASHTAPRPANQCVALPEPAARAIYGRVTDAGGNALAGARVFELDWTPDGGAWRRRTLNSVTSGADGSYVLPIVHAPDAVVVFEHGDAQVVWSHVTDHRRIDVVMDRAAKPGIFAAFDGRTTQGDRCAPWECPLDHDPGPDWWLRPDPCPDGGHVAYALGEDHGPGSGVAIACKLNGELHGAYTSWWLTTSHEWMEDVGWNAHGKRCGQWRATTPAAHDSASP